jgi:hypothetical protein
MYALLPSPEYLNVDMVRFGTKIAGSYMLKILA